MARADLCAVIALCCLLCGAGAVSIVTDSWIQMATPINPPSARDGHTAVLNPVNNTMIIFGGKPDTVHSLNDITIYYLETDEWAATTPGGKPPAGRYFHSAVVSAKQEMVVFGGRNNTNVFNDISVYDLVGNKWVSVVISGAPPSPRIGHSAVLDPTRNQMIVYGGQDKDGNFLRDTVFFDLTTFAWLTKTTNGTGNARAFHSAAVSFLNVMIVFGGTNGRPIAATSCYSLVTNAWFVCGATTSTSTTLTPDPLWLHTAVMSPVHKMVIFGGRYTDGSTTNQVWNFNLFTYQWEGVSYDGIAMDSRYSHSAIASPFGTMVLFGGVIADGSESQDFAKYNLATTVLRNANDGAVMVVLISLVGAILIGMCYAMDYMQEQNALDKEEAVEKAKEEVRLIPKIPLPKIPLGPKAQKFFNDIKVSLDPLAEPPQ